MSEEAVVKPSTPISKVWLIPLLALMIGGWMIFYQWSHQGPLVRIELSSAAGIEANKTPIKVRDLEVGQVKKIELKPDLDGVIVTARVDATASHLLTENTEFWIVAPRISFSEVSGLNTLLSGSYIAMSADDSGEEKYDFVALERPPVTPPGTPGLHITLSSDQEDLAYKAGDPIIYKGFKVGEFEEATFNIEERVIYYTAFINAPYHTLINENTRFWNVSGVKLQLASTGVTIQTGSLETLLANGITFGVPDGASFGEPVEQEAYFKIYPDYKAAEDERYKRAAQFVLLIKDSVRGLKVGAPVEYRGLRIGEVKSINDSALNIGNVLDEEYPIPVLINIYPGKVRQQDNEAGIEFVRERMRKWIQQDLRATLRMGSFITGGLYIDLQHIYDAPNEELAQLHGYDIIPTASTEFTQLTQKADAILDKINNLPLEMLITDIRSVVASLDDAATSVESSSDEFDALIASLDGAQINHNVNTMLKDVSALMKNYSEGGLSKEEIHETINALQETLRNLQPVLLQLNQSPNSFIFSDNREVNIQPRAAKGNNND